MGLINNERNVVVIGAAEGIGKLLCEKLCDARFTCNVIIAGISMASSKRVRDLIINEEEFKDAEDRLFYYKFNALQSDSVKDFIDWITNHKN